MNMENVTFEYVRDFMINSGWEYTQDTQPKFGGSDYTWKHVFTSLDRNFYSDHERLFISERGSREYSLSDLLIMADSSTIKVGCDIFFTSDNRPTGTDTYTPYTVLDCDHSNFLSIKVEDKVVVFDKSLSNHFSRQKPEGSFDDISKFNAGDIMLQVKHNICVRIVKVTDLGIVIDDNDTFGFIYFPKRNEYLKTGDIFFSYSNLNSQAKFLKFLRYTTTGYHEYEDMRFPDEDCGRKLCYFDLSSLNIEILPRNFTTHDIPKDFLFISDKIYSFLTDECGINLKSFGYTYSGDNSFHVLKPASSVEYNFYDFSSIDNGRISGLSKNKFREKSWDDIASLLENRASSCTFNKISKLLSLLGISDNEIIKLVSTKLSVRSSRYNLSVVKESTDITKIYNMCHGNSGNISSSCMRKCDYFELYDIAASEGNTLSIAYIEEDSILKARALIWKSVKVSGIPETISFMDRIYSASDSYEQVLKDYAKSKGHHIKQYQSSHNAEEVISPTGEYLDLEMSVKLSFDITSLDYTPYMDTFLGTDGDSYITNFEGEYELRETDGSNPCNDTGYDNICERCSEGYNNDDCDSVHTGDYGYCCSDCARRDGCFYCDYCEEWHGPGEDYYNVQGMNYCQEGYNSNDCFCCDHCKDYHEGPALADSEDSMICENCIDEWREQNCEEDEEGGEVVTGEYKFKIGDKVKVKVILSTRSLYSVGAIGEIVNIDPELRYHVKFTEGEFETLHMNSTWWAGDQNLELYTEPLSKERYYVKVVKVTSGFENYYSVGATGYVKSLDSHMVRFIDGDYRPNIDNCWGVGSGDIEPCPEPATIPEHQSDIVFQGSPCPDDCPF